LTTDFIDYFGYRNCIRLDNRHTRVILLPHSGGRVLSYTLDGIDALYENPEQQGWTYSPDKPIIEPCAGRFDIGPETIIPRHPLLWLGPWTGEIIGEGIARLTSLVDENIGTQLVRTFELSALSSRLRCTQTIVNVSDRETRWCHWSRTFAQGGGICIVPLSRHSRFPRSYLRYEPDAVMNFLPEDPAIRIREGCLEVTGPPLHSKLGLDSYAGWLAYLMRNGLIFLKGYPAFPGRLYNEMAGLTLSIWYPKSAMCELEPIGPMERLAPGESASFTETWWMGKFAFPGDGEQADITAIKKLAERELPGM